MSEEVTTPTSPPPKNEAEQFKVSGNDFFKQGRYGKAIEEYTKSLDLEKSATVLSNRAFAHLKCESFGSAIQDAKDAIEIDPTFTKAYYRRASANLALGRHKEALSDLKRVVTLHPNDKDAVQKYQLCERESRKAAFFDAIKPEDPVPLFEQINLAEIEVGETYKGPRLEDEQPITVEFVEEMMELFKNEKLIHKKYVFRILIEAIRIFRALPNCVPITVPDGQRITVCGDTHGQFYDLLNIFNINGKPSPTNWYLFNGDFVDRGSFSLEVVVTLLAWKVVYPEYFYMTRGNHEGRNLNKMYGFEGEVKAKYDVKMFDLFQEVFLSFNLCCTINNTVFVVHGGLFSEDNVTIEKINSVNRFTEADHGLVSELLWSDPLPFPQKGRTPNKRGVGVAFGYDVTENFLNTNNLSLVIRSHEVKDEGYEYEHGNRLITIFSAPNYCDTLKNKGAFIHLVGGDMKPKITSFTNVPHPNVPPMKYSMLPGMVG